MTGHFCQCCNCCCCCFACPAQETVSIIETCGKFSRVAQPGCNVVCCCLGETVSGSLSLRVQQLVVRCETKTKDNVFVHLAVSVQYQVRRDVVFDAFYKLTNCTTQISSFVFDEIRATVPKLILDDVYEMKEDISKTIKDSLAKSMEGYGYYILHVLVNDIEPAAKVKCAMNEINAARRLRVAAVEKAETEKLNVVKAAEAESEAKYLQGQGIARQRQAIISGLRDSVTSFQSGVSDISAQEVLQLMVVTQYFDMLRDIGHNKNASTVFLNHAPSSISDVASQIRNSFMEAQAATGANKPKLS